MKKIQNLFLLLLSLFSLSGLAQQRTTSGDLIRKEVSQKFTNGLIKQLSLAQLRASTPSVTDSSLIYFSTNSNNLNLWKIDNADNTTPDDGNNVIVSANGKRFKKLITTATQTALDSKLSASQAVTFAYPKGTYNASSNTPFLTATPDVSFENGAYYEVTTSGSVGFAGSNFSAGTILNIGDKITKFGSQWGLLPYAESTRLKRLEAINANYSDYTTTVTNGFYVDFSGTAVTSASRNYTSFSADVNDYVKVTTTVNGSAIPVAIYKNSSGTILGTQGVGTNGVDVTFTDYALDIPSGTATILVNGNVANTLNIKKGVLLDQTAQKSVVDNLNTNVSNLSTSINTNTNVLSSWQNISSTITDGYYYSYGSNTAVSSSTRSYTTLSVTSTDQIKITTNIDGAAIAAAIYKNSSGSILGTQGIGTNGITVSFTNYALSIPSGTSSVVINGNVATPIVIRKYSLISKAVSGASVDSVKARVSSTESNITSIQNIASGYVTESATITNAYYYSYATNTAVSSTTRSYTTYSATNSDQLKVSATINGSAIYLAIYKNSIGGIIGYEGLGIDGTNTTYTDYSLTIPSGTTSIVINGSVASPTVIKKYKLFTKVAQQSSVDALTTTSNTSVSDISGLKIIVSDYVAQSSGLTSYSGYYLNSSGTAVASASRTYTIFNANNSEQYKVTSTINGGPVYLAVYLNSANAVIGTQTVGVNGSNTTYTDYSLTIPSGTAKIAINGNVGSTLIIKKNTLIPQAASKTDVADLYTYINSINLNSTVLSGKTVLFLGTSITEGSEYALQAPAKLGGTGINKAVGSSTVRKARFDGTANGLAWQNYCYSLSQTLAEKDSIINNWNTIRLILTNNPPSTMDSTTATFIRNCSYERRLIPYLDGTYTMPDFFILEHGRNDNFASDTDTQFTSVPSNRTNRYTYIGAMNYLIDLIVKANPFARIAIEGHYENDLLTRVSTAQLVLADYWNIPINRVWEKSGFSQQIAIGSKSLWTQSPWNLYSSGQNTSLDMNRQRVYLPDGIHLHSATDGKAQTLMTNIVAEFLKGLN